MSRRRTPDHLLYERGRGGKKSTAPHGGETEI